MLDRKTRKGRPIKAKKKMPEERQSDTVKNGMPDGKNGKHHGGVKG